MLVYSEEQENIFKDGERKYSLEFESWHPGILYSVKNNLEAGLTPRTLASDNPFNATFSPQQLHKHSHAL